jgi:hypothetical protein
MRLLPAEVNVRQGHAFGCFLIGLNALVALAAVFFIALFLFGEPGPSEENDALQRPAEIATAALAPDEKYQDRIAPSGRLDRGRKPWPLMTWQPRASGLWSYGDAKLRLDALGRSRRFTFAAPSAGHAAKYGDVAFEGVREGAAFSGMAFAYSEGCPPLSYPVKGAINAGESTIVLRGMEPRRTASCEVLGASFHELVFSLAGEAQAFRGGGGWLPQTEQAPAAANASR